MSSEDLAKEISAEIQDLKRKIMKFCDLNTLPNKLEVCMKIIERLEYWW